MPLIGAHVSISGGIWKSVKRAEKIGCEAMQIFTKNQVQWFSHPLSWNDIYMFQKEIENSKIKKVVAHASYLINLASPDEKMRQKSILAMIKEIERCDSLGITDIVLHPGSHLKAGEKEGIKRIVFSLNEIFENTIDTKVKILLETTAGQGTQIGYRLEQLRDIIDATDFKGKLGVCLDTCHLFAAGYDIDTEAGFSRLLWNIERLFGFDIIRCVHLNDSRHPRGSRLDRHTHIGKGYIGTKCFALFLNEKAFKDTPMLIETPKERDWDVRNISYLRKLRGY